MRIRRNTGVIYRISTFIKHVAYPDFGDLDLRGAALVRLGGSTPQPVPERGTSHKTLHACFDADHMILCSGLRPGLCQRQV